MMISTSTRESYLNYLEGLFLEREGKISAALNAYKKSLDYVPESKYLQREVGRLYLRLGEINLALEFLQKLAKEDEKDTETLLLLAQIYLVQSKTEEVNKIYEKILTYEPFNREAILNLANIYSKEVITSNEFKKAISLYEQYLNIEPLGYQNADILFKLANLYEKIENKEKALNLYQEIIENFPYREFLFLAHLNRAKIYETTGEKEKSLAEYEQTFVLEPENTTLLLKLGSLLSELKRNEEAKKIFLKVITQEPKNVEANYYLLLLANEEKNWDEAIKYAKVIAQLRKEDPKIYFQIGYFYTLKKETKKAVKALKKTVGLEPNNPDNFYLLGLAYQDLKKYDLAEKAYLRALELKPDNPEVLVQLAILYDLLKDQKKALEYFRQVLSFEPKNATALNYIGYTYAEQSINLDEAENLIRQALEIEPKNAAYLDSLGWVYYQKKDYLNALIQLEEASQLLEDQVIFEHLGDTYQALNKVEEAKNIWEKALKLNPKNKKLQDKIKEINQYLLVHRDIRKLLKRQEGNQRQIFNLVSLSKIEIDREKVSFSFPVLFYYRIPKSMRIDFLGTFSLPQASIIVEDNLYKFLPGLPFSQETISENEILTATRILQDWLNGELYAEIAGRETKVKKSWSYYRFYNQEKEAKIEKKNGLLCSYSFEEENISKVNLEFNSYFLLDGLWFPKKIKISFPTKKLSISLFLEEPQINQKLDEKIFSLPR
jgi:tetratricopeptide (TPR) repeat protein